MNREQERKIQASEKEPRRYREGLETLTYSVWEAARVLGIGRETCYGLIRRNELKSIRIGLAGSRWRVPRIEIEAFMNRELEKIK